ncbi:MAG: response regulator [Cryobacterium sp.]|jgi:CheY-like chemotaxis protein|nr:response regulator [Cryobacterium sp.]
MREAKNVSAVKVLVVEDGDDQRFLVQRYFELAGCEVTATESAEAALNAFDDDSPDVAVIDLILPGMNGWELAERIQRDWPECVVVISSVLDVDRYPKSDAQIVKPVTRAKVTDMLGAFVPGWAA